MAGDVKLTDFQAELDVLNIQFGDDELFRRNAEFSARYAAAERRAARVAAVFVAIIVGTLVVCAIILRIIQP